jgi:hypothetical protein
MTPLEAQLATDAAQDALEAAERFANALAAAADIMPPGFIAAPEFHYSALHAHREVLRLRREFFGPVPVVADTLLERLSP